MACKACNKWRSRAFDGLRYIAWHAKADKWGKAGRKQRMCGTCGKWRWVRRGQEDDRDEAQAEEEAGDPYHDEKKYHMTDKVNNKGGVSALCFKRPRAINLDVALWTLRPEAVTCKKCLRLLRQAEQGG